MRLESGPLSAVLDAKEVREAAAPFVRVLVRVPEAYPLLGPYEATRPGLLVMDADGRRVDALALKDDSEPAAVAKWLRGALEAPARERLVLRPYRKEAQALAAALSKAEGVSRAEVQGESVLVIAKPGVLNPYSLAELGRSAGCGLVGILEPEEFYLCPETPRDTDPAIRALSMVPGVWAAGGKCEGILVWVTRLLIDPVALKKALPEYGVDVEERRYALPGVSQGPPAMKIATALQDLPGILTLRPALAAESLAVVGRKGVVDWAAVLKALRSTGIDAKEKD